MHGRTFPSKATIYCSHPFLKRGAVQLLAEKSQFMNEPTSSSIPPAVSRHFGKLAVLEKIGFGVGDLASGLLFSTFNMFLLFFYTNVVGLSASAIFWIFMVAKFWDMVNDPIMGAIADRTHTRLGRYRPYILFLAIPYGISAYMLFTVPEMSQAVKVMYCGGTYIIATMMYTGVNIPYCALMGVLTPDVQERTSVSQYRFFLAFLGGWLINTFTLLLARLFGGDTGSRNFNSEIGYDPVAGFSTTMMVFGILAALLFLMTFLTTRERIVPAAKENTPFRQDVKDLFRNLPWLILFASAILNLTHIAIRNGAMLYYLNYCVADSAEILFSINFSLFEIDVSRVALFMSAGSFVAVIGVAFTQVLVRRFGKARVYMYVLLIQAVLEGLIYFAGKDGYSLILSLNVLSSLVSGMGAAVIFAMYADVADYSEWKTTRRATGLIIATILFAIKGGLWLGGQVLTGTLALIGYTATTAGDPGIQEWIQSLFT